MTFKEMAEKGKWLEIKADLQETWGRLSDMELDKTKGDTKAISGLIQKYYGEKPEVYSKKVTEIITRH